MSIVPIKAIVGIASSSILLAQITPTLPAGSPTLDSIGRLTLDSALVFAVIALWRALQSVLKDKDSQIAFKDQQLITMTGQVTATMTSVMSAVQENRAATSKLEATILALPRALRDEEGRR